jgi:hypothetical protein
MGNTNRVILNASRTGRLPLKVVLLPVSAITLALIVAGCVYLSPLLTIYAAYYLGALATAVVLPTFLIPRLWQSATQAPSPRIGWAFRLNALRGGLMALSALAFVLLPIDFKAGLLFKALVVTVPTLVMAIPLTGIATKWLLASEPQAVTYENDRHVGISKLVTIVSWIGAVMLVALVIRVFEYWPVSLKHGPDTEYARDGFQAHFGFDPKESIDQLYFRKFLFWQTNETHVVFHYRDRAVVDGILQSFEMDRGSDPQSYGMLRLQFPARWLDQEKADASLLSEYYRAPYAHVAWVDTGNQVFYYLAFLD